MAPTAFTTPSRSAFRMFCIFMASMTATVSPALTSWPTVTAMETTRPGMGDWISLEVSAACFSGRRANSSAIRGVRTRTRALVAPVRIWKPSAMRETSAV